MLDSLDFSFAFWMFQVDLQREELLKEGSRVHIPSKVFQVLLALVEQPGEIVTRETDSQETLCVSILRQRVNEHRKRVTQIVSLFD